MAVLNLFPGNKCSFIISLPCFVLHHSRLKQRNVLCSLVAKLLRVEQLLSSFFDKSLYADDKTILADFR
jgi:hypothetical protein